MAELYQIARMHYPNEYGGLLIGRYSGDMKKVILEHTLLPQKYSSSKYHFDRGMEGLRQQLELFYQTEPPLIYVGEWHSHPDNPPIPSKTDLAAMREVASSPEVHINNPVLLIMSISKTSHTTKSYLLFKNKLYEYNEMYKAY